MIEFNYFQIAASALLPASKTFSQTGLTTGIIADLVTGSILGLVLVLIFELTGYDVWWYKGTFFGAGVWLLVFGVALNLGVASIHPSGEVIQLASFIEHLLFGISAAYFIVRWSSDKKKLGTR